jgi:hypothetical protein
LLGIVFVSVSVLWVLARIRFPDTPPTPNPVPPVLAQLAPPSPFDTIADAVSDLEPQIRPLVSTVAFTRQDGSRTIRAALRFENGLAVTIAPVGEAAVGKPVTRSEAIVAADPESRLTVVRVPETASMQPRVWSPPRTIDARHFIIADASTGDLFLRPAFIGPLTAVSRPALVEEAWAVSKAPDIPDGALVFTVDGSLAGVAVDVGDDRVILPAGPMLAAASALAAGERPKCGDVGVEVQALTPALQAAIGVSATVAVAWVDPNGPAAGQLLAGDAIDTLNGQAVGSVDDWRARIERLAAGEAARLGVLRDGAALDLELTARDRPDGVRERPLGLTLGRRSAAGASVIRVDLDSAGAHAGLREGDVITRAGDLVAPTPAQIVRLFRASESDRPLLFAVSRGAEHLLIAVEKSW